VDKIEEVGQQDNKSLPLFKKDFFLLLS